MSNTLPYVKIALLNNQLGQSAASDDGISLLVVSGVSVLGQFALGDLIGPLTIPTDINQVGIANDYDDANDCLAYQHIKDFYDKEENRGTELYVIVVAKTVTMEEICDKDLSYLAPKLEELGGKVKLVGITRVPDAGYIAAMTTATGFDDDAKAATLKAKDLIDRERDANRPVRFMIEFRNCTGVAGDATDLIDVATSPQSNGVVPVMASNIEIAALKAEYLNYAAVGYALGVAASIQVQRNIGRVLNGSLSIPEEKAGFSNGAAIKTLDGTKWELYNKKGYVFFLKHQQYAGIFFNDDHTATVATDDYNKLSNGRTIDKAQRITHATYIETLLDDFDVDENTGKIDPTVLKNYESKVENAISSAMISGPENTSGKVKEIVGVNAVIDPFQNVISTNKLRVKIQVSKKGMQRYLEADLGFTPPQA